MPILFLASIVKASPPQAVGPIDFGGGLNLQGSITDIKDNQSPDQCNCVSNQDGSLSKVFGSKRFVEQSMSSWPVTGLYHTQATTGTTKKDIVVAVIGSNIVISTSPQNPNWIILSSYVTPGQNWSFVTMNNKVIMTGDGMTNPIYQFDIFSTTLTPLFASNISSESVQLRAKYLLLKSNYLLFINCADITQGTTFYPSRVYFSLLNQPSSAT